MDAAALGYAAAAGGGSAAAGYAAGGFVVSSIALGPAIDNTINAFERGDRVDQGFAVAGLTGVASGLLASHLSVWHLLAYGGPVSRTAMASQTGAYVPDQWLDTRAHAGNIVIGSIPVQSGGRLPNFYSTIETLAGPNGVVDKATLWRRLQVDTGKYGPQDKVGIYRFRRDATIARGVTRANKNYGDGGYPQLYIDNPKNSLELVRVLDLQ